MNKKELEYLIKENLKDTALRIHELDFDEIMMLPYEAYTNKLDRDLFDDLN